MTQCWEPGVQYNHGDVVSYEGHRYKIIQPHRSQSDWTPPITPALWGRMSDQDGGQQGHSQQSWSNQQPQNQQPQNQPPPSYQQPQDNGGQLQQGYQYHDQKPTHEEAKPEKTHWYDDKSKLALGIGGGVAAGLLAGGIHHLIHKHEKDEHQEAGHAAWVNEARMRAEQFNRNGPQGPATWLLTQGKDIPRYAIEVGREHSAPLYICRAYWDGGKQVGKASTALEKGAVVGYKHKEHHTDVYEILLGDMNGLRWVPAHGKVNVSALGYRPVEGGHEKDGTPLYVIKAMYDGIYHPGKASATLDGAYIPYGGTEKNIKEYQVLCYNS
ncbi:putative protein of unknown function (DUF3421) [Lyophyllum shimeji]|uniref:Chitin-binding type-3 domain-containing protein n=1 Tax=Lyophyllum shimeji TaxID=47721 RepID=A0A9P3PK95_LYOSH|nr:putative protein of unknown function (DUF3421) [Lyophyllum shimeji]